MLASGPILGSMPTIDCSEPSFFTCRNWSRKSSSEKPSPLKRLLGELFGLLLVELLLGLLDERKDVAHAQDAAHDAVGMEGLDGVVLFADAQELDGLAGDVADGQRRAAAGIAVHLGQHHAGEGQLVVELLGGVDGVLSGHGVGHEQDLLRVQQALERLHLVHQLLVDVQAAGGIDDQHVAAAVDGLAARFLGQPLDGGGVGLRAPLPS